MALFITFEGGEGSGKSTQAKLLHQRLKQLEIPSLLTHEPGETPLGEKISGLLRWRQDLKISPAAELLLFNSSRAQLVSEVIKPALKMAPMLFATDTPIHRQPTRATAAAWR